MADRVSAPGAPAFWLLGEGAPPSGPHVALVPGQNAPALAVDLPESLSGSAREQVAGRQLVEQLSLSNVSFEMHPLQPKGAKHWSKVVVVDRDRSEAWRGALQRGSIALLPDYMALPTAPGLWVIHVAGDMITARLGIDDGFSSEKSLAEVQLSRSGEPEVILRLGDEDTEFDELLLAFDASIVSDLAGLKTEGVTLLRWADSTCGLDLKAPPSAAEDRIRDALKRWRFGAFAAIAATLAWVGMLWFETEEANARAALNEDRIEGLVRQHFVASGPVLDVRAQVTAAVEEALVPDVIELQTVPSLTQFQIAAEILTRDGADVLSVFYRPETGLETIVSAQNFSVLDEIIIGLQDAAFLVEQLESRAEQSGGVVAQLRLELFE